MTKAQKNVKEDTGIPKPTKAEEQVIEQIATDICSHPKPKEERKAKKAVKKVAPEKKE